MRCSSSHASRAAGAALAFTLLAHPLLAQDTAAPARDEARPVDGGATLAPMDGVWAPPARDNGAYRSPDAPLGGNEVERVDLAPVMSPDGSGLPYELWRGMSAAQVEELIAQLQIPPRSAALNALWRRLITSDVALAPGLREDRRFLALRIEALERSGLVDEAAAALAATGDPSGDPVLRALYARNEIGLGNPERGCEIARGTSAAIGALPQDLKGEIALIAGYCGALAGDMPAATLGAGLARELGLAGAAGPDALDAIASGARFSPSQKGTISLVTYRILELGGHADPQSLVPVATPGLLAVLARSPSTEPLLKVAAAEAAASVSAIGADDLAAIYRDAEGAQGGPALARAALFRAAEREKTPMKKARLIREYLDDARRAGLYGVALEIMARPARALAPAAEIGWFTETAIETSLAAQDFERARTWAAFGSSLDYLSDTGFAHWFALADIADPQLTSGRGAHLGAVERMARQGRFSPDLLHRLATVLDALDIEVPIPLWELASRAPQPAGGYLPDTGVLSELADAAQKKEFGRTVLVAMRALGPDGAEGAHIAALRDSVRALKRAGLKADAHRLGFEALFAGWPRAVVN